MPTVTYRHQPGIEHTHGNVPLAGTSHVYRVTKRLWPDDVEAFLTTQCVGRVLHVCCGKSQLGDCRVDRYESNVTVTADATQLPFRDRSWDTILIDPPYNGVFQWNHDMLSELGRVAGSRIIFQHWFIPVDRLGRFKKNHWFEVTGLYCWQPKTYFGRVQMITVMDRRDSDA